MKKYSVIFVFLMIGSHVYSFSSYSYSTTTLYYGTPYRFNKSYRHSFSIDRWFLEGACTRSSFKGAGVSCEWKSKSDYSFGARFFFSPQRHPAFSSLVFYMGTESVAFSENDLKGITISPQSGFHLDLAPVSLNLYYSYDFPVLYEFISGYNGHRVNIKMGIDMELFNPCNLFVKKVRIRF